MEQGPKFSHDKSKGNFNFFMQISMMVFNFNFLDGVLVNNIEKQIYFPRVLFII